MTFLLIFFISLLSTIFLTPYLILMLEKGGVTDSPDSRKVHKGIIPRMGGLVIFIVVFILTFAFYPNINSYRFLLLGMIIISVCGSIDDVIGMRWNTKFILQSVAVALLMIHLITISPSISLFTFVLPLYIGIPLLFFFILGTINAVNLMDGMDGLVSGYSLITFSVLFLLSINSQDFFLSVILAALAGSLLGYLKFNAFPARIFLGDFGSLFLGYTLVALTLISSLSHFKTIELVFPIILLAVPILDTIKVFFRRIFLKRHPFLPDNEHLHHVIFHNRVRQKTTVFLILIYNLFFIGLALYYYKQQNSIILLWAIPFVIILFLAKPIFEYLQKFDSARKYMGSLTRIPAELFTVTYKVFIPVTSIFVLAIIALLFPVESFIPAQNLLILLVLGLLVLTLSLFHKKHNHQFILNIYFFFNISIYLILGSYPNSVINFSALVMSNYELIILSVSFIVVILFIGLFAVGRERILPKEKIFLTGIDLTMIIFVLGSFIFENLFPTLELYSIPEAIFLAFVLYLWYKIIYLFNERLARYIFVISFLIPIFTLSYLLLQTL